MAKRTLSDKALSALKPAAAGQRYEIMDTVVPGFGVRVTDKGRRTFVLVARYPGGKINPKTGYPNPARRALGEYGELTLADARAKARQWLELISQGRDPKELEEREEAPSRRVRENSFAAVAETFIRRHVEGHGRQGGPQRRAKDAAREIRHYLIPRWGDRQLEEITRRDVIAMVEEIVDQGAPEMARQVLGRAKTLFGWAVARDMIEHSPADRVHAKELIGKKKPRQRVLSDEEIVALWRASRRVGYPFGPIFRLLLLTGTRKSEASGARWPEFDLKAKVWTVPAERFKSDAPHQVPLTDDALAVLEALPRFAKGDHLFSTTFGAVPISGFSKAKARLDRHMLRTLKAMARKRGDDPATVELKPFVIHDLRRTVRTRLASLKVPEGVAEMIIGHGKRGLARVYDQHQYADEMREALDLWAAKLRSIVEPPPPNVVRFGELRGG